MSSVPRVAWLMVTVTILAGAAGGWLGVRYGLHQMRSADDLDELLHQQLHLRQDQKRRLTAIEASFTAARIIPEQQMRLANRELAIAIVSEHSYGPAAQRAIEHFHQALQVLQEETVEHVLAMRSVLTPVQARQFDRSIAESLASNQP